MELIVMVGPSGSGKSTIAKQLAALFNYEYISSDEQRKRWYGDEEDQTHNFELFCRLERLITKILLDGRSIVFDATNLSRKARKRIMKLKDMENVFISAVVVHTSIETAKKRNSERSRSVPEEVIDRQFKALQMPTEAEGFRAIFNIDNNEDKT